MALVNFRKYAAIALFNMAMIIIALSFVSCSDTQNYLVLSQDFEGEKWSRFDVITAEYNVVRPMTVDVFMELTLSDDFPNVYPFYKNDGDMPFCMYLEFPDGNHRVKDYKYSLKDKSGNWKSEKIDGYYHFDISLMSELNISESGICKFVIENKYSKDPLYGIKNMTIKCVPSKTK